MISDDVEQFEHGDSGEVVDAVAVPREREQSTSEQLRVELEMTTGFLPPPTLMDRYNKVIPGFAESMLEEWHQENRHRRRMEERIVDGQFSIIRRGQFLAFGAFFVAMGFATYLIADGKNTSGLTIMIGSILAIVSLFLFGPSDSRSDASDSSPNESEQNSEDRQPPSRRDRNRSH